MPWTSCTRADSTGCVSSRATATSPAWRIDCVKAACSCTVSGRPRRRLPSSRPASASRRWTWAPSQARTASPRRRRRPPCRDDPRPRARRTSSSVWRPPSSGPAVPTAGRCCRGSGRCSAKRTPSSTRELTSTRPSPTCSASIRSISSSAHPRAVRVAGISSDGWSRPSPHPRCKVCSISAILCQIFRLMSAVRRSRSLTASVTTASGRLCA
jgi:hypothetical protein